ncbi:hypothetical protein ACVW19_005606 [Streptomyces sp. TE5632]
MSRHARSRRVLHLSATALVTTSLMGGALVTGVATPSLAASPSTYEVKGVDTSHHNHDATGKAIDWKRVARGNSVAFLKATQGTTYKDPWFTRDFRAVSGTSLLRAPSGAGSAGPGSPLGPDSGTGHPRADSVLSPRKPPDWCCHSLA